VNSAAVISINDRAREVVDDAFDDDDNDEEPGS